MSSTRSSCKPIKSSRMRIIAFAVVLASTSAASLPTQAAVVFDSFGPNGTYGQAATGLTQSFSDAFFGTVYTYSAINFSVSGGDYLLNSITLPAQYIFNSDNPNDQPAPVNVSIYDNTGTNEPGTALETIQTSQYGGLNPISFAGSTTLQNGHSYWIVSEIQENTNALSQYRQQTYYAYESVSGSLVGFRQISFRGNQQINWNQGFNGVDSIAFRVDGTAIAAAVPEPETYAMLLTGLGVVGMMGRRRNSKKAT